MFRVQIHFPTVTTSCQLQNIHSSPSPSCIHLTLQLQRKDCRSWPLLCGLLASRRANHAQSPTRPISQPLPAQRRHCWPREWSPPGLSTLSTSMRVCYSSSSLSDLYSPPTNLYHAAEFTPKSCSSITRAANPRPVRRDHGERCDSAAAT